MLPREHRLTDNRDFKAVFAAGKAFTHRLLVLKVRYRAADHVSRFGFSTSTKLGNAVVRNRAKRLVRESVRLMGERLRSTGYDAVLIARPPIREAHFAEVSAAVEELLRKAGLLQREARPEEGRGE